MCVVAVWLWFVEGGEVSADEQGQTGVMDHHRPLYCSMWNVSLFAAHVGGFDSLLELY